MQTDPARQLREKGPRVNKCDERRLAIVRTAASLLLVRSCGVTSHALSVIPFSQALNAVGLEYWIRPGQQPMPFSLC